MDCNTAKCYGSDRIRIHIPKVIKANALTNWAIPPPTNLLGKTIIWIRLFQAVHSPFPVENIHGYLYVAPALLVQCGLCPIMQ